MSGVPEVTGAGGGAAANAGAEGRGSARAERRPPSPAPGERHRRPPAPALGESQRRALDHLKRRGASTIPVMAEDLGLNVETVRAHVRALRAHGLVVEAGSRRGRPGRPEIVYALAEAADALFPSVEASLLAELATYIERSGRSDLLQGFFEERVAARRAASMERVRGLEGDARLDEVARILSEEGFMAVTEKDARGRRLLRLCHCPMRNVVAVTGAPCRVELAFVRELLGERLSRESYIPAGDASCSYGLDAATAERPGVRDPADTRDLPP